MTHANDAAQDLAERVRQLEATVQALTLRMDHLDPDAIVVAQPGSEADVVIPSPQAGGWAGNLEALPQRIATACFILVLALVLRTITDNGTMDAGGGTLLGLGYALILSAVGWFFHARGSRLTPVFSLFGFLLLFLIVIEGYGRFQTLSSAAAVPLLFAALISASTLGIRYRVPSLLTVCCLGTALAGLAPAPMRLPFAPTALLFLLAESRIGRAADRGIVRKLVWVMTLLTLVFWYLWTTDRQGTPAGSAFEAWGIGLLLLSFGLVYFAAYLRGFGDSSLSRSYTAALPMLNAILLYFTGHDLMVRTCGLSARGFGGLALGLALGYAVVASFLSKRHPQRKGGVTGAWIGTLFLLLLALPPVTGSLTWALPAWAAAGYALVRLPFPGCAACMRVLAYCFACIILGVGLASGALLAGGDVSTAAALSASFSLALCNLAAYAWCRNHPLTVEEGSDADRHPADVPVVLFLLVGLAGLYGMGWSWVGWGTARMMAQPHDMIQGLRSVFLCLLAMGLLIFGGLRRDRELARVAVAVGLLAAVKVFVVDMVQIRGLALILGVLAFGLLATAGSVVMGKWDKGRATPSP